MADLPMRADPRNVRTLRDNFRRWLSANQEEFQKEILTLLKTATKADHERVVMACKLLDKFLPDQREYLPVNSMDGDTPAARPVNILIGEGIRRGPDWVKRSAGDRTINVQADEE
jgi:hypothetical protein